MLCLMLLIAKKVRIGSFVSSSEVEVFARCAAVVIREQTCVAQMGRSYRKMSRIVVLKVHGGGWKEEESSSRRSLPFWRKESRVLLILELNAWRSLWKSDHNNCSKSIKQMQLC
jgi:hypothetical protein